MNPRIGRSIGKAGLMLRKNIPNITTAASIVGVVGTGVLSARAAYKSVKAVEEHKKTMEQLRANKNSFETDKEYNKEVASVYKNTAIQMAKVYWPAALAGGLTIAGIFTTNKVHKKRYLTMAGMYTTIAAAYSEYRKRVSDKYGEEAERELYFGTKKEEVVTVETDKKGKEKTNVEVVTKPGKTDSTDFSVYYFDINDKLWYYGRPELTYYYLMNVQNNLNQLLRTRGYLFLNEVLRALDKPEVPEGQLIGWIFDENKGETDNCVDFGLKEGTENFDLFMSGKNQFVYITLNHDGTIYDKFPSFDRLWKRHSSRRV